MIKKMKNNPMHNSSNEKYKYMLSLRCGALTRQQIRCLSPAVHGKKRCRMHGGAKGSGAPKGNKNAFKHGLTTKKFKDEKCKVKLAMREFSSFIKKFP